MCHYQAWASGQAEPAGSGPLLALLQLYCFERSFGDTRLLVAPNLSSAAEVVPGLSELAAWSWAEPLITSVAGSCPTPTDPLAHGSPGSSA